jgi:hypothetical protein
MLMMIMIMRVMMMRLKWNMHRPGTSVHAVGMAQLVSDAHAALSLRILSLFRKFINKFGQQFLR